MLTSTLSLSWSSLISDDLAGEVGEGALTHPHRLALLVLQARSRLASRPRRSSGPADAEECPRLPCATAAWASRRWPTKPVTPGVLRTTHHESSSRSHADQQVAREHLLLDDDLLAALELDDVFHGDDDLEDPLLHVHRGDAARGSTSPCSRSPTWCGRRTSGPDGRRGSATSASSSAVVAIVDVVDDVDELGGVVESTTPRHRLPRRTSAAALDVVDRRRRSSRPRRAGSSDRVGRGSSLIGALSCRG